MELRFKVFAHIAKPVHEVFEAVADPSTLSKYFTTGGALGRIETGATVTWDFHDFPGAFPVHVIEAVQDERIVPAMEGQRARRGRRARLSHHRHDGLHRDRGWRHRVEIAEEGWRETPGGLQARYGNCMGWSQMLCTLKVWLERGLNLRERMYKSS